MFDEDDSELAAALGLGDYKPAQKSEPLFTLPEIDPQTLVNLPPREQFAACERHIAELAKSQETFANACNADYLTKLEDLWRKTGNRGKKAFDLKRAESDLGDAAKGVLTECFGYYQAAEPAFKAAKEKLDRLRTVAADAIDIAKDANAEDHWFYAHYYADEYRTQGGGAEHYAKVRAELTAANVRADGIKAEVRRYTSAADTLPFFAVYVYCAEADLKILRCKSGLAFGKLVQLAWKMGANPRVYFPFLPHDFESKHGFDQFGNDLPAAQKSELDTEPEPI